MFRLGKLSIIVGGLLSASNPQIQSLFGQKKQQQQQSGQQQQQQTKTYIWGNGHYQARPDSQMKFKNFEPKLISTFLGENNKNLKEISFGDYYEAGIDTKGNIYVWDKHILHSESDPKIDDSIRSNVQLIDGNSNNLAIAFTKGFLWTLKNNGEVWQYPIKIEKDQDTQELIKHSIDNNGRKIPTLQHITQIAAGEDHFVALTQNGQVYTMGDDTQGQCGQGSRKRSTSPPFYQKRIKNPGVVEQLPPIKKVVCGANHTLALSQDGILYGWGSNSNLQLSHELEFAKMENPLLVVYSPVKLERNMSSNIITDMAAGEQFSILVTKNRQNNETEVFGCGHNVRGELGLGYTRHVLDITKLDGLSNYKIETDSGLKDVDITSISCGNNHCLALLNIGALVEWGDNEYGQMGNKKRNYTTNPIIVSNFTKDNILKVVANKNNSAVITELISNS